MQHHHDGASEFSVQTVREVEDVDRLGKVEVVVGSSKEAGLDRYRPVEEALFTDCPHVVQQGIGEAEAELYWDEILERAGL